MKIAEIEDVVNGGILNNNKSYFYIFRVTGLYFIRNEVVRVTFVTL